MVISFVSFQVLFLYISRILVGVASSINPFIYATTIPKFKEAMQNFTKSFVSESKIPGSESKMKESEPLTSKNDRNRVQQKRYVS